MTKISSVDIHQASIVSEILSKFPGISNSEYILKRYGIVFSLIVISQGLMGGLQFNPPRRIKKATEHPVMKFILLFAVALTASRDVETAFISTIIFIIFIYIVRHPDERKSFPY